MQHLPGEVPVYLEMFGLFVYGATTMKLHLGIIVVVLLSYTSMFDKITVPNERTRMYLAVALVDDHSVSIDGPVDRFGKTADIAKFEDRFLTDKAPGASFLGAVVYGAVRIFSPSSAWSATSLVTLMRIALMVPIGIWGFFLLRSLLHQSGICERVINIVSVAWILGTSAFHYSTAFYGHQIAAVAMLLAVCLLQDRRGFFPLALSSPRLIAAGAAAGFAALTEYQSIFPCLILGGFAAVTYRNHPRKIALFVIGALPFATLLLGYHKLAFGGFFELPYQHLASNSVQALHSKGIAGVGFPRVEAMWGSLFSLHRGLLTTSPIFLLFPYGIYRMFKDGWRSLGALIAIVTAYYLLFIFGAEVWYAGWSFGPRLLVPVMGLAMMPIAFALKDFSTRPNLSALSLGAVGWGVIYHQIVHVVFPELPESAANPIFDVVIPALRNGVLSPNLAAALTSAPGLWTLIPPVCAVTTILWSVLRRRRANGELKDRIRHSALVLAITCAMVSAIWMTGPTWRTKQSIKFTTWMAKMEHEQFKTDKADN